MRQDMAKVVTERPRYGHASRSKKTGLKVRRYNGEDHLDDLPKRLPSSRHRQHGWDAKEFSDRIGPLKKFLQSRVGQHWDRVYSELSRSLDKRSITGLHIWDHVWMEVENDCVIGPDGLIYQNNPRAFNKFWRVRGLYIHPKTGILSWAK